MEGMGPLRSKMTEVVGWPSFSHENSTPKGNESITSKSRTLHHSLVTVKALAAVTKVGSNSAYAQHKMLLCLRSDNEAGETMAVS